MSHRRTPLDKRSFPSLLQSRHGEIDGRVPVACQKRRRVRLLPPGRTLNVTSVDQSTVILDSRHISAFDSYPRASAG